MRVDVDFESYAAARWHLVVRTLVLLGVPPGHAATLAREALVRRHPEWSHQDAFDDLDAELYREVLELKRRDHAAWWSEPAYDDELWIELEPELDRLTTVEREWLVLRHVAELPESYIEAVLEEADPGLRPGVPTGEQLREVARLVPVPLPELERVVAAAGQRRRSRRRRTVALTVGFLAAAGVAALIAVLAGGDESESSLRELEPAPVQRLTSDSAVAWYSFGRLHLAEVVIDLPDLRAVATVDDDAVYLAEGGDLVHVDVDGERTVLDTIGPGGSFAVSDGEGLVAWLPEVADAELVVHDLGAETEVVRVPMAGSGRVIAIDDGTVFFNDDAGDHQVTLASGEVQPLGTGNLIDIAGQVRLYQATPETIRAEYASINLNHTWPGQHGELSEEGTYVVTRVGGGIRVYDTRSGERVRPNAGPPETVFDAVFGRGDTIAYLVINPTGSQEGVNIRTCPVGLLFLESGLPTSVCTEQYAGQIRDLGADLQLAR